VVLCVHISVFVDSLLKQTEQKNTRATIIISPTGLLTWRAYVLLAEIASYLIGGQLSQDLLDQFLRFFHETVRIKLTLIDLTLFSYSSWTLP